MQQQLAMMGVMHGGMDAVDSALVAQCDTEQDAFLLCYHSSKVRRTQASVADMLGMRKGDFNLALNSKSKRVLTLSRVRQIHLQQICQNTAIDQWADLYAKGMLNCQRSKADRAAELRAELARLEGVA